MALVLACVLAITSYSPIVTYADDDQGHFDTTAPVIDEVITEGVKESYEQNEMVQLKVHMMMVAQISAIFNLDFME